MIGDSIDALYQLVDGLCHAARWAAVDAVLLVLAAERDLRMRVAVLTITLNVPDLALRGLYAEATHEWVAAQGQDADAVLAGLWPEREGR